MGNLESLLALVSPSVENRRIDGATGPGPLIYEKKFFNSLILNGIFHYWCIFISKLRSSNLQEENVLPNLKFINTMCMVFLLRE